MTPERFRRLREVLDRRQPDLTVLAEGVHKPHNFAAILRSCDAVGVLEVHAVAPAGDPEVPAAAAAGTAKWVAVHQHGSIDAACESVKSHRFQIIAAHFSDAAVDYRTPDYTRPTALLVGTELYGVSARAAGLADVHVSIPMRGHADSLNVSVATALLLYEAARQREAAGAYARPRLPPEARARRLFEWCYPQIARACRRAGRAYPALDEDGFLLGNPFTPSGGGTKGLP